MKYFQNREFIIRKSKFIYQNALFDGKGFMNWDPEKGFDLRLLVQSDEYNPPKKQTFGTPKVIKSSDRQNIHLYIDGYKLAVIPSAYLGQRLSISLGKTLSIRSSRLVLLQERKGSDNKFWVGKGLFKVPKKNFNLPDKIKRTEKINDIRLREGWSNEGIHFENSNIKVIARLEDEEYLRLDFKLLKEDFSYKDAIFFSCGFQYAISFLLGVNAVKLKTEITSNCSRRFEISKVQESKVMSVYKDLETFVNFQSELVGQLSLFFMKGYVDEDKYKESYVSRLIVQQLFEAEGLHKVAQELLTATILEAALRTLNDRPFRKNGKSISIQNELKGEFKNRYHLNSNWDPVLDQVILSQKNLRDRNAHPDWLYKENDVYADDKISDTIHDLRIMIKFYQQMILVMAEIDDVRPELPQKIE